MEGVRKRAGVTPAKATNGTKSPVELAKIRKTKKHQERLEDSWLLTALALALLAVFALGSVYVYRDELFPEGFKPYNAPEAAKATADVALCSLPLPHDFACPEAGACPLPDNEACAARYAKMDTVAELRMVERKPQLTIVSAEPAKGNEAKHTVLIGPQQPHNGTKIDAYTTQPPTESCANVAVNVTVASADPWLIVLDGFLTDDEVDHVMKNGMPGLQPSGQFHGDEESKKAYDASYRTSSTAYIGKVKDEIVTCIERRASDFSGYPLPNIEALQFLRYQIGQEYKHHWDYFPKGYAAWDAEINARGQRTVTFFVYLNDLDGPDAGGETDFPRLNLKVSPKKGRAVFWYDTDAEGEGDPRTFHAGLPVKDGIKYAMNIWIRERAYYGG